MYMEIKQYVLSCESCQRFNHRPGLRKAEMGQFEIPTDRFNFISLDILGPFIPSHKGNRYCLVIIDLFTRWPEAIPIPNQTTETITKAFVNEYVSRHSLPSKVISDLGPQFVSNLFSSLMEYLEIQVTHSLPYFHQTTGMVERLNQSLEQIICHYTTTNPLNWDEYIPMALFALRTSVHSSTSQTPFFMTYLRDPLLPYDKFLSPFRLRYFPEEDYLQRLMMESQIAFHKTKEFMMDQATKRRTLYDKNVNPQRFTEGQVVYVRDLAPKPGTMSKLNAPFKGPYRITKQLSPRRYEVIPIYKPSGRPKEVHHDHMRKGYLREPLPLQADLETSSYPPVDPDKPHVLFQKQCPTRSRMWTTNPLQMTLMMTLTRNPDPYGNPALEWKSPRQTDSCEALDPFPTRLLSYPRGDTSANLKKWMHPTSNQATLRLPHPLHLNPLVDLF